MGEKIESLIYVGDIVDCLPIPPHASVGLATTAVSMERVRNRSGLDTLTHYIEVGQLLKKKIKIKLFYVVVCLDSCRGLLFIVHL